MKVVTGFVAVFVCSAAFAALPVQRTLSFDERVNAQAAIERVYYAHQLGATKPFTEAVPRAVLESKVRKYLEQTVALQTYWKTSVTDETLQRELERMAQGTRMPERLEELYTALGNDAFLIKECLARPTLVDRLTHNFYAFDPTMHVKTHAQAEAIHRLLTSGALSPWVDHPNRTVSEIVVGEAEAGQATAGLPLQRRMSQVELQTQRAALPAVVGEVSDIKETREGFAFGVILSETATTVRVASYVVPKVTWDSWWETVRGSLGSATVAAVADAGPGLPLLLRTRPVSGGINPRKPSLAPCADYDTWNTASIDDPPDPRSGHTAVWTGSLMVVWGGGYPELNTGGRYDPATDSWAPTSTTGAPVARALHTAVWTGSEMIVWGGVDYDNATQAANYTSSGGRYDPATDSWTPTTTHGAPFPRINHTAVWTGSRMVVWGGVFSDGQGTYWFNTGGQYDPVTNTWSRTSTTGAPAARSDHTAVWTGSVMVVWGGFNPENIDPFLLDTGGRYDPETDTWTPTSTTSAPLARRYHTAVWTGSLMVVWGGESGSYDTFDTGSRYNPATDSWTPTSTVDAPLARRHHTAVWTESSMVVWGGDAGGFATLDTGARYDPVTDNWTFTAAAGAPSAREGHTAVWTGGLMLVWGGSDGSNLSTGGRYDPITETWTPLSSGGAPSARVSHTAVWTGSLMVVWGGFEGGFNTGGRYDPATDDWTSMTTVNAPSPRGGHTAVWTGSLMVVWGGARFDASASYFDTGGRYDPVSDSWTSTSATGAPSGRIFHTAVWTGNLMVVWGGRYEDSTYTYLNTGGRYDPETNAWASTSTTGTPSVRSFHSAVWTGSQMVVWGGGIGGSNRLNTGGRYNPATDSWAPTSTTGAPFGRGGHTAVWTGNVMVVWGGTYGLNNEFYLNTGGRYDPASNTWNSTSTTGAPQARNYHTAIWTGRQMVVWGGSFFDGTYPHEQNSGGRYDPATNTWTSTPTTGAPSARLGHSAVWTGSQMVVWGGVGGGSYLGTGGRYRLNDADRCDDGNPCTNDACNATTGCVFTNNTNTCDNGNACTINTCQGGSCVAGPPRVCFDNNPCTDDSCNSATGCVFVYNTSTCDDGYFCTVGDSCHDGQCSGTRADGMLCDDGNLCTTGDACFGYYCYGGPYLDCDDGKACTDDSCNYATGCVNAADDTNTCSDENLCTDDSCHAGICTSSPVLCNSGCPQGFTSVGGLCQKSYDIGASLLDNQSSCGGSNRYNSCNFQNYGFHWTDLGGSLTAVTRVDVQLESGLTCGGSSSSVTLNGRPVGSFNLVGSCSCSSGHGTVSLPNLDTGAYAMADWNVISITPSSACEGLSMSPSLGNNFARVTVTYLPHNSTCEVGTCAPATGECSFSSLPDGTACNDDDACTGGDICSVGSCIGGSPTNCDDYNPCTVDSCDPQSGCVHVPEPEFTYCDDYNACTGADYCDGYGTCVSPYPPQCDDHIVCTEDYCDPEVGCSYRYYSAATSCSDDNACNGVEFCDGAGGCAPGTPPNCNDNNPCTDDSCSPAAGCVHANNTNSCNDGNACTPTDVCAHGACTGSNPVVCGALDQCHTIGSCDPGTGACSNPSKPDGSTCNDASLCTTGETCQSGTCAPAFSGLNEPNPRSTGYYKRLCIGPHSGDQLVDADAVCVGQVAENFAGIATVADICAVMRPQHPNDDPCDRTEQDLMALALNICRARVCAAQSIDSQCGDNGNVGQSLAESDAILSDPSHDATTCAHAKCLDEEINTGRALELNSLGLRREGSAVRLDWRPPYLDDGSGHPSKYHVWRRVQGSFAAFTKIGVTTSPTYLDALSGSATFEYEVTAVMN